MKKCSGCKQHKDLSAFSRNRSTKDGLQSTCKECQAAHYVKNIDKIRASNNAWHKSNKEKERLQKQRYYQEKRDEILARNKIWHEANPDKHRQRISRRRAAMKNCQPAWADEKKINAVYAIAKWLEAVVPGQKYHVDHVIPIQNNLVCGLHVHENLSVLKAEENLSKQNKFEIV